MNDNRPLQLLILDPLAHSRHSLAGYLQLQDSLEVVAESTSAAEAIELARQYRPDAVIMDANPPDMAGLAVIQQLLSLDAHPTVILLATHHSERDRQQALLAGAAAYIARSAGIDQVLDILQKLSKNSSQMVNRLTERRLI